MLKPNAVLYSRVQGTRHSGALFKWMARPAIVWELDGPLDSESRRLFLVPDPGTGKRGKFQGQDSGIQFVAFLNILVFDGNWFWI